MKKKRSEGEALAYRLVPTRKGWEACDGGMGSIVLNVGKLGRRQDRKTMEACKIHFFK